MATRAQIAANRRNGAKSTGPRTEGGRAAASRNSLKHGLTAEQVVLIFGETEDDFTRFHDEMRASFGNIDPLEPIAPPLVHPYQILHTLAAKVMGDFGHGNNRCLRLLGNACRVPDVIPMAVCD